MRTVQRDIVGAFIFSADDKLLLGKAGVYAGAWLVPGGGIDEGETTLQAVIREIREETGLDISGEQIEMLPGQQTGESEKTLRDTGERVLVHMTFNDFTVRLPQRASDITVQTDDDYTDARWFAPSELHALQLSPVTVTRLKELGYLS